MARERDDRRRVSAKGWADKQKSGFDSQCYKIPEGTTLFRVEKVGSRRLDFLCWKVGKGNPNARPGELHFELTFWTHRLGPDNRRYVCPSKTANRPCPVCEQLSKLRRDPEADENLVKSLFASKRQLWLAYDLDDMDAGPQLIDYSYHQFGKIIKAEIDNADEEDEFEFFADFRDGKTLKVAFDENPPYGFEVSSVHFKNRAHKYEDGLAEELPCLEDMLIVLPYDKLKAVFLQESDEDDDEDKPAVKPSDEDDEPKEKPTKKSKPSPEKEADDWGDDEPKKEKPREEKAKPPAKKGPTGPAAEAGLEEGMMVRHRKLGVCELVRISGDGTSLTLKDSEGDLQKAIEVEDVRVLKEEAKKEPLPKAKPAAKKDDDDDDGWGKEDDEPKKSKGKKAPAADDWD